MTAESLKQALRSCKDVSGARQLLREMGYPVLSSAVEEEFSDLPDGARQVVPRGHLLSRVEDESGAFRIYHLHAYHTTRTRLRAFFEPFYRRYPQGNYLFIVQPAQGEQVLFVSPRRQLAQAHAAAVKLVLRTLALHPDEPFRTDLEILQSIALPQPASAEEIWQKHEQAFNVERVTQRFFEEYRRLFENAESRITGIPGDAKRLFTQKLFNRLMFIRFLERKGWLRFSGRRDYLRALWEAHQQSGGTSFYRERLKPLFFAGLNTPQQVNVIGINRGGWLKELIGEVPYLNGGLFAQGEDDRNDAIDVPDEVIEPVLHELLYRFNFTITESSPLDVEVAVDPEMLGKVFEELVTGRHETGSYYTPRPVVAFMCREALKGYLQSAIGEDADATARFVDQRDASALKDPEKTLDALRKVRVCDPACGSGAYLLGMLHELLELRSALFEQKKLDPRTLYDRKLEIIQRNLYGVDIDPFAVEIARLRLWLSLVVDDERNPLDQPDVDVSLPNLDFKIEVGDSLLAPDPQGGQQPDMFRQQQIEQYERLKAEYMRAHSDEDKRVLRAKIEQLREEIRRWAHPDGVIEGFDWRVEFAEVFKDGGFDIVVANPPYVRADAQFRHLTDEEERQRAIARWKAYRQKLLQSRIYQTLYEKWDLYIPFLERAYQLLRPNGRMVYIISDAYNAAKYAQKSHEFFLQNTRIARIDFCSEIPLFEAGVNNTILHFAKVKPDANNQPIRVRRWGERREEFEQNAEFLLTAPQEEFGTALFRVDGRKPMEIGTRFVPLGMICYISYGLRPSVADKYRHEGVFFTEELVQDHPDATHPKPYAEGKDFVRWWVRRVRYLEWGTDRAPHKFYTPTFPELYTVPEKLMALVVAQRAPVVYDRCQLVTTHTSCIFVPWYYLKGVVNKSISKTSKYQWQAPNGEREVREQISQQFHLKYVLAVMNSLFALEWLNRRRRSKIHIYPDDWKGLPIALIPMEQQMEFVKLVDAILAEFRQHGYPLPPDAAQRVEELEREIDERVSKLYRANDA